MNQSNQIEGATQARRELARQIVVLGSAVTKNAQIAAEDALSEKVHKTQEKIQSILDDVTPRAMIRRHPLTSLVTAFACGFGVTSMRKHFYKSPAFQMIGLFGVDLLRAYASTKIGQHFELSKH